MGKAQCHTHYSQLNPSVNTPTNCVLSLGKSLYDHYSHLFLTISFLILYEEPFCLKDLSAYPVST